MNKYKITCCFFCFICFKNVHNLIETGKFHWSFLIISMDKCWNKCSILLFDGKVISSFCTQYCLTLILSELTKLKSLISAGYLSFSLAIDPSTGNIYYAGIPYTFDPNSYIGVVEPRKGKHTTIFRTDTESIVSIAIYPAKGWVDWITFSGLYYMLTTVTNDT